MNRNGAIFQRRANLAEKIIDWMELRFMCSIFNFCVDGSRSSRISPSSHESSKSFATSTHTDTAYILAANCIPLHTVLVCACVGGSREDNAGESFATIKTEIFINKNRQRERCDVSWSDHLFFINLLRTTMTTIRMKGYWIFIQRTSWWGAASPLYEPMKLRLVKSRISIWKY